MNLAQIISQADSNSYFSRSDADKYSAANSAGFGLYLAIQREHRGFFVKFDTTSVVLTPGTSTYTMPPDFSQLVHFAERLTTTEPYHPMSPTSIGRALDAAQAAVGWTDAYADSDLYGGASPFAYDGPYLTAPATTVAPGSPQIYQTDIAPAIDQTRMTELVYIAKWLPILNSSSTPMLPDEAQAAWLSLTTAILLDMNGDTTAMTYRNRGVELEVPYLLSWARQRSIANRLRVSMFDI